MALSVKLQAFEGPLDLLLHLIEKNKVDIYDIPIVEITEQYLDYIKAMETEDMNVMSEFLVMAATLLDIKCKMLLPKEVNEEGEEEDPRAELVQKLLEYKMYKYMSYELKDRQVDAARTLFREKNLP
ncbi:MAG: segregation/condensation protein A, partial [Lachnospiraceae bacterium]|nr:segregation/condensation protein A [Lachnospiraceae bacterium]